MKVLVTLGCSMTEGQGCWGNINLYHPSNKKLATLVGSYLPRFRELGWPNIVGKRLGFDKVINLGSGGSSTSGQVKMFYERDFSNYETYVIWMLTQPSRFSFYNKGAITNYQPQILNDPFSVTYLREIKDIHNDSVLEQLFYVKALRSWCQYKKYKLVICYWSSDSKNTQGLDLSSTDWLYPTPKKVYVPDDPYYKSQVCMHPNEIGYEYIANEIVNGIQENHPQFVIGNAKNEIEWEWDGDYKSRIKNISNYLL